MSHENKWQIRVVAAGDTRERVEILNSVPEVGDDGALSIGTAMPNVVNCVNDGSVTSEGLCHMGVAATVFGIPMDYLG